MATVYIAEFPALEFANLPVAIAPPLAEQIVVIGSSSTQSSAFSNITGLVRVHTDSICSVAFGRNPTANSANARLAAGQTEYFVVRPGSKLAVIVNS